MHYILVFFRTEVILDCINGEFFIKSSVVVLNHFDIFATHQEVLITGPTCSDEVLGVLSMIRGNVVSSVQPLKYLLLRLRFAVALGSVSFGIVARLFVSTSSLIIHYIILSLKACSVLSC